ncbi:MAG TPA: protease complex subunit PrcB family protein [Candidatus Copromonas avistercoris]|nr:protease complex subunit PrcB family protein [Candidatus Copromonas avistercoris]
MPGKGSRPGPKWLPVLCAALIVAAVCAGFTGCRADEEDSGKIRDLDFTVVGEGDVPGELARIIAQKREGSFRLTYADGSDMYIVIGEGPQQGGGYSVTVNELYLTDNAVVIQTELLGPEKGEASGADMSYPVLIVKTQYMEEPVVFQ